MDKNRFNEKMKSMKMRDDGAVYTLNVGYFEGVDFVWKKLAEFKDFDGAYKGFSDICRKIMNWDIETLLEHYNTGRVDVNLKTGDKNINWFGININATDSEEL